MKNINSIAIVGGTHGNELTGIQLVNNLKNNVHTLPSHYQYTYLIANPKAVSCNQRYIDVDLNRQFTKSTLPKDKPGIYEFDLANMLNQKLGPKGDSGTDLVVDIHNTTSAMGPTLIVLEATEFYRNMAGYMKQQMPQINVLVEDEQPYLDHPYLCTCGTAGVMLELGPQAQGVSRADIYNDCLSMLTHLIDFITLHNISKNNISKNNGKTTFDIEPFPAFRFTELVYLPMDNSDNQIGLVHPNLLDADFQEVKPGEAIFSLYDGGEIRYQGENSTYPHFINEAAYNKDKVAFSNATQFMW